MKLRLIFLALCLVLGNGCVMYLTKHPAVAGQVVDAKSHAPVAAAQVSYTTSDRLSFTDTEGRFAIPVEKAWFIHPIIFPVDYFPNNTLAVRKKGYQTCEIPGYGRPPHSDLRVELKRAGK